MYVSGTLLDSSLTLPAYMLAVAGDNSAELPVVTETEVEAMAQVPKVPKTVKRKEPAAKRPPIVTALGSTNYLAIHDAQGLSFLSLSDLR